MIIVSNYQRIQPDQPEDAAAEAYNRAAKKLHGEFATLNTL